MLNLGKNIQSANDPLKQINSRELYEMITSPSEQLSSLIQQLRTVLSIDPKKYNILKRSLPYVVCGMFTPPYRRKENFASIDCFIVDIDHLSEKNIDMEVLREKLTKDSRIVILFTSPGNDGLKALFNLSEKCYDTQQYSIFYKLFIKKFSNEYSLEQVIDKVTSDGTRACFLSVDEKAWYNPNALTVNVKEYIDFESYTDVTQAKSIIKSIEEKPPEEELAKKELTPDLLKEIKQKLNPNIRTQKPKDYYVPMEVDSIIDDVKKHSLQYGIELTETNPISYGRKLKFKFEQKWAQLNLFYGKKGYRIVKTPVTNSDKELAEVVYKILCQFFYGTETSE